MGAGGNRLKWVPALLFVEQQYTDMHTSLGVVHNWTYNGRLLKDVQ